MIQTWALGLALVFGAAAADNDVVQTLTRGKINWSARTMTVTGSGPPALKAPSATVARLGAERQAKSDALQNFVALLRTVPLGGGQSVAALLEKTPELRGQLEAIGKAFKTLDTRYFADGGVDIVAELSLDGPTVDVLFPPPSHVVPAPAPPADGTEATGVVLNARGLKVVPALAPRVLDESGQEVYGPAMVNRDLLHQHGAATYSRSLDAAQRDPRVADKAVVVRAVKVLEESGGTDLLVSTADGQKLAALAGVLAGGRVIIVID